MNRQPAPYDVVALLTDLPSHHLARGQVGTIVEILNQNTMLVEFSGDDGRAYALAPIEASQLLLLQYHPEAA